MRVLVSMTFDHTDRIKLGICDIAGGSSLRILNRASGTIQECLQIIAHSKWVEFKKTTSVGALFLIIRWTCVSSHTNPVFPSGSVTLIKINRWLLSG